MKQNEIIPISEDRVKNYNIQNEPMETINWSEIEEHEVLDGLYGKFLHTTNTSIVRWRFDAGSKLPKHNHLHEQITMVQFGNLQLQVGEKMYEMGSGDIIPIKPYVYHSGLATGETIVIDVFSPVREDFREKYS